MTLTRLQILEKRIQSAEERVKSLEANLNSPETRIQSPQDRIKTDLLNKHIYSYRLVKVDENYYDESLDYRANLLKCNTSQLCKSIVFENTACEHSNIDDPTYSRYYCIIVQYEGKIYTTQFLMHFYLILIYS